MTETRHTPGPWLWGVRDNRTIWFSAGDPVAGPHWQGEFPGTPADARLISAAPAMFGQHEANLTDLDLLRIAIKEGDPQAEIMMRIDDLIKRSRDAMARATT